MKALMLVVAVGAACGSEAPAGPDAAVAPTLRNPVTLPDDQLAPQALEILGKLPGPTSAPCKNCHPMVRSELATWRVDTDKALPTCFVDLAISTTESALAMIDCMRAVPGGPAYAAKRIGILSTGAELPWFEFLFWRAYGDDRRELDKFIVQGGMPKGSPTLSQAHFDLVTEWFLRGLPNLEAHVPPDPTVRGP